MTKRKLTPSELDDILSFITYDYNIPLETKLSIINKHKCMLKSQLVNIEIYPSMIPELKKTIKTQYYKSIITPGDNVGIESAQNIGKEQTQTTLDSFHKAGSTGKLLGGGISRFNEILSMTKDPKTKSMKISLKNTYNNAKEVREDIGNKIINIYFKKLVINSIIHKSRKSIKADWYSTFEQVYFPIPDTYCIVYSLNITSLFEYNITLENIRDKIQTEIEGVTCVISPLCIGEIHIYFTIDIDNIEDPSKDGKYNYLLDKSTEIEKINISGIEGINNVFYFKEGGKWYIETDGTNFKAILSHPKVDINDTISTHVWDIYNVLGIEAAREYLIDEISSIMTEVNSCHIKILVDVMTYSGTLTSISRHAMQRDQTGPMAKAAFEETLQNFQLAAINGEVENTKAVNASIIYGKLAPIGTGSFDLLQKDID